jgi:hypothetical protein
VLRPRTALPPPGAVKSLLPLARVPCPALTSSPTPCLACSADADFSCFADLALTSPVDYYKEGQGSLMQCVITPAEPYLPKTNEEIAAILDKQVGGCKAILGLTWGLHGQIYML